MSVFNGLTGTGKCIGCGKRFEITPKLAHLAEASGCVISPCCSFPSTVEKVEIRRTINEGHFKKNLNNPPTGPRVPAPRSHVAPRAPGKEDRK